MKFLVDENIGMSIVRYLRDEGYDAVWIKEECRGMKDDDILRLALRNKRVLLTYDQDFGELIFNQRAEHCGVLLLRLGVNTPAVHIKALGAFLKMYGAKEIANKFWKVDERYL